LRRTRERLGAKSGTQPRRVPTYGSDPPKDQSLSVRVTELIPGLASGRRRWRDLPQGRRAQW